MGGHGARDRPATWNERAIDMVPRSNPSRHVRVRGLASVLVAAAMTVAVVTGGAAASAAAGPNAGSPRDATARSLGAGARNVASILRPDGSVRTEAAGSFSVKGYRMVLAPNGAPRFLPGDQAAASGRTVPDPNWDDRFGEPGVQNGIFPNGVNAIAVDGNDVYVGGLFDYAGGAPFAQVVRWDGDSWHELSGGITGAPSDQDPEVDALVLSGTTLYVGGIFDQVKNGGAAVPASTVAAYDTQTDTWSALGTGITLGSCGLFCTGQVKALAVSGSTLFAAGSFGHAGTVDVNSIAKWNGTAWSALGRGLYSCADCPDNPGDVRALQVSGSTLYAGGSFSEAGTEYVSNIAQWNIGSSTWSAMGDGVGGFFGGVVDALAMHGSN